MKVNLHVAVKFALFWDFWQKTAFFWTILFFIYIYIFLARARVYVCQNTLVHVLQLFTILRVVALADVPLVWVEQSLVNSNFFYLRFDTVVLGRTRFSVERQLVTEA